MSPDPVSEMLGLRQKSSLPPLYLLHEVEKGLPLIALDRLAKAIAPGDSSFPLRLVARATLARRRKAAATTKEARLSAGEGARVARLAGIWAFARDVWGNDEEARDFLFRPHPLLENRRPLDVVLANEFGRPLVENILGGLNYGTAV